MKIIAILSFVLVSYSSFLQGKSQQSNYLHDDGTINNIKNILKSKYEICYANFYIAYKYEFFTHFSIIF